MKIRRIMMFRILIVEDEPKLLEELRESFRGYFPDSKIELAGAVDDALQLVKAAFSSGWFYDVAVLDLRLPRQEGGHAELDETICREIRDTRRDTLVIHISAYGEEQDVLRHLENYHDDSGDPQSRLLKKGDPEFWDKLEKKAKEYLYGGLIEQQMDKLFPYPRSASAGSRLGARSKLSDQGSLTLELNNLARDIATYWDHLDEKLRCRIQERFNVYKERGIIRVSFLG
jgi:CheY-like chemotaxis protein